MKKNLLKYLGLIAVVVLFAVIFIPEIVKRLNSGTHIQKEDLQKRVPLAYIHINEQKKRIPEFAFYNQDSLLISEQDFIGKVYVVEFFFASCPTICPIMNKNLVEVQNEFLDEDNFGIASFTIDPEHDTPEVLRAYADRYGIVDMDWHLLNGSVDQVYELANAGFNIYAQQMQNVPGGFEHSGLFALVDKEGYIRSRRDQFGNPIVYYRGAIDLTDGINDFGETEQITILIEDIKKLLNE
ncbi:MAG: SCO family protein [Flavobacteriaceae bacterium]|nr:SCO family protein [Flavobacteriaceae bacterium]NVJ71908.1 SCO family protein [Flavobacteriaceae bacterium]